MTMRLLFLFLFVFMGTNVAYSDETREKELLQLRYAPITHASLSNLIWRFGAYEFTDYTAIDDYIAISNCPLYTKYYTNDFLWQRVRNGISRQLEYYSPQFPDRYEIISAIDLGRYNFQKSAFILPTDSQLRNVAYFTLSKTNSLGTVCNREVKKLPVMYSAVMSRSINLSQVPVGLEDAKSIINNSIESKNPNKRMAVLRVRLKILNQLKEDTNRNGLYSEIKYKTEIDEMAIFENTRSVNPIWQRNFKDLKR